MKTGLVIALMLALDGGAPAVKGNGRVVRGADAGVAMKDGGLTDARLASEHRDGQADGGVAADDSELLDQLELVTRLEELQELDVVLEISPSDN